MSDPLVQISSKHCQSQTGRARELKFWENLHPTQCVLCHVSHVMCHLSHVTCHLSHVTCHMSHVTCQSYLYHFKKIGQSGGASWWRVCYQRSLPRLVYSNGKPSQELVCLFRIPTDPITCLDLVLKQTVKGWVKVRVLGTIFRTI